MGIFKNKDKPPEPSTNQNPISPHNSLGAALPLSPGSTQKPLGSDGPIMSSRNNIEPVVRDVVNPDTPRTQGSPKPKGFLKRFGSQTSIRPSDAPTAISSRPSTAAHNRSRSESLLLRIRGGGGSASSDTETEKSPGTPRQWALPTLPEIDLGGGIRSNIDNATTTNGVTSAPIVNANGATPRAPTLRSRIEAMRQSHVRGQVHPSSSGVKGGKGGDERNAPTRSPEAMTAGANVAADSGAAAPPISMVGAPRVVNPLDGRGFPGMNPTNEQSPTNGVKPQNGTTPTQEQDADQAKEPEPEEPDPILKPVGGFWDAAAELPVESEADLEIGPEPESDFDLWNGTSLVKPNGSSFNPMPSFQAQAQGAGLSRGLSTSTRAGNLDDFVPSRVPIQSNLTQLGPSEASTTNGTPAAETEISVTAEVLETLKQKSVNSTDLLPQIKNLYRLLELYSEQGSGGLVDKVIISQDSLKELVDVIKPGVYSSVTKIDFAALDSMLIKPLGIYGSRSEIVTLLRQLCPMSESTFDLLRATPSKRNTPAGPTLASGIYVIIDVDLNGARRAYVIYWPEETAWNDDAISAVRRNRATFMRYLTKLTDQQFALISPEHAEALVWETQRDKRKAKGAVIAGGVIDEDEEDNDSEEEAAETNRLFRFHVEKVTEEAEGVTIHPGFEVHHPEIRPVDPIRASIATKLQPRLVSGEIRQGFITAEYIPAQTEAYAVRDSYNQLRLESLLRDPLQTVLLDANISPESMHTLLQAGIGKYWPEVVPAWEGRVERIKRQLAEAAQKRTVVARTNLDDDIERLSSDLQRTIVSQVLDIYSAEALDLEFFRHLAPHLVVNGVVDVTADDVGRAVLLPQLVKLYSGINEIIEQGVREAKFSRVTSREYIAVKNRFVEARAALSSGADLSPNKHKEIQKAIIGASDDQGAGKTRTGWLASTFGLGSEADPNGNSSTTYALGRGGQVRDPDFMNGLYDGTCPFPDAALGLRRLLSKWLIATTKELSRSLAQQVNGLRLASYERSVQAEDAGTLAKEINNAFRELRMRVMSANARGMARISTQQRSMTITSVRYYRSSRRNDAFVVDGTESATSEPQVEYTIHPFSLTEGDKQSLSLNPNFIPEPQVRPQLSIRFSLPAQEHIRHVQLFENGHCMLVVDDPAAGCSKIFLEHVDNLAASVHRASAKKKLFYSKVGSQFLFAIDERKRFLAIITSAHFSRQLHVFVMDEGYSTLQARGAAYDLTPWFPETPDFSHVGFVPGTEEIYVVEESTGHVRTFSMVTEQFKPASIFIHPRAKNVLATSDGSCLVVVEPRSSSHPEQLRSYHFSSIGNPGYNGIILPISNLNSANLVISSLGVRSGVHALSLSIRGGYCASQRLHITNKSSDFTFREQGQGVTKHGPELVTKNNCLLNCHAEVWTRYPVIAAIPRQASSSTRVAPFVLYIADRDHERYEPHFRRLIKEFELSTRKPTAGSLSTISVKAVNRGSVPRDTHMGVSAFPMGNWLVDLLCLIPIHVAVTGLNRFIPLKDGVLSPEFERSLLGADLPQIVNSLSLGWYESIFRTYMATKPVKVVSSMGEQSTGKSYALNHLVDTSFAGSAMRCTEGVWLSLTPTDKELIVALDFEGIHSIERSAQEDMLLVLFNTALSNLVLFRNNFAMSRDIASLFKSFQASTSVLDPASNPNLFRSTLAIIIKDVVDADVRDIVKEFALKFEKIVRDEREDNFISKLHRDKIRIIPWPVIESPKFYSTMGRLKEELDDQAVTHVNAAIFLDTMKTLMAKLKICDWGAVDQNLVAHRTQTILSQLPVAMMYGVSELDPEIEPLKNLDTNEPIASRDTPSVFFLNSTSQNQPGERELRLLALRGSRSPQQTPARGFVLEQKWTGDLQAHLSSLALARITHVREWIASNMSRFGHELAEMDALKRAFEEQASDLVTGVELCKMTCGNCELFCLEGKRHDGPHDCKTSHRCEGHKCDFDNKPCGVPAGHDGQHLCDVNAHMCGQVCELSNKRGCQGACTQPINHTAGPHICSSRNHACGAPCALSTISPDLCGSPCIVDCRDEHEEHVCENRATCPVKCALCARLCIVQNHFHALEPNAVHLCGQEHACKESCQSPGICTIATAPQSVESTFVGRHETFQYTKYTQVASRGLCIKPIAPGALSHEGPHAHSTDPKAFHFCETRCPSCGYFCTLPLNHTQATHETSHGSMENTVWVVDGDEADAFREVSGRRFASGDAGATVLCNQVCSDLGRHAHIDLCRTKRGKQCSEPETEHIMDARGPKTSTGKDWITHNLHWSRSGFKDPYSQDLRTDFAKCDAICPGPEHNATDGKPAKASQCTLSMFHRPVTKGAAVSGGHVSTDGHSFTCRDPVTSQSIYHVIFLLDRSGSMFGTDRQPLANAPSTATISTKHKNRYGAVLSALTGFWGARSAATAAGDHRADAYSIILFNDNATNIVTNDLTSSPATLLAKLMEQSPSGGTNFRSAITAAQKVMEDKWSNKRLPVLIFLSDGEAVFPSAELPSICNRAKALGHPLSFHAVAFGPDGNGVLNQMADTAKSLYTFNKGSRAKGATMITDDVPCTFTEAIDTIKLAETFLDIAESMRKPRAALLYSK